MVSGKSEEPKQEQGGGLKRFHGEAATTAIEQAGITYQAPSLIAAGAEAQSVSLLSFLTHVIFSFLCINAPGIVRHLGPGKRAITLLALVNVVTWLPIAAIFSIGLRVSPVLLIVLWVLNVLPSLLCIPLRDNWLAETVPGSAVGRYLGVRAAIAGAAYLSAFYAMGYVLDQQNARGLPGFAIVFTVAAIAAATSLMLYRGIRSPTTTTLEERGRFGWGEVLRTLTRENLGRLVIFVSLFSLAVNLCRPLFAVYLLKDLSFSYLTFSMIISAEFAARIISVPLWGRYADNAGDLGILGIVSRVIPFLPILWLFSPNVFYLIGVQLLSGVLWAGFDLYVQTIIYQAAPSGKRLKYIVYHRSLSTMGMALGALAGAYILTFMVPVFGSTILGLFLLSGLCQFAVVKTMFHRLVSMTFPSAAGDRNPAPDWAALLAATTGRALFYQPREWLRFTAPVNAQADRPGTGKHADPGFFYRPADWKLFTSGPGPVPASLKSPVSGVPAKPRLYHHPEAWNQYAGSQKPAPALIEAKQVRTPFFYHPENWRQFAIRDEQKYNISKVNKIASSRPSLLRRPQEWSRFLKEPAAGSKPRSRLIIRKRPLPQWILASPGRELVLQTA